MRLLIQLAGDRPRQRLPHATQQRPAQRLHAPGRATAAPSAMPGFYAPSSRLGQARAVITPPPATGNRQPRHDHQEVAMNPIRSRLIRRVAGVLAGLAVTLAPITTGPAAVASPLRPDPPGWLTKRAPVPERLPFLPPGWNKHPPLPGPAHALPVGMPGWQITLIAAAAVLAAAAAVLAGRIQAARRRAAATTTHQPRPRCT